MLSPVSSHVFERRLVVKYVNDNGTDPVNGQPLSVDQLLEIKGIYPNTDHLIITCTIYCAFLGGDYSI